MSSLEYYSILTEEEIKKMYGEDYNVILYGNFYWNSDMNYLFGKEFYYINDNYINKNIEIHGIDLFIKIPRHERKEIIEEIRNDELPRNIGYWVIHISLFKRHLKKPTYNPRKIIKESINEKDIFVFICNNDYEFTETQKYLFSLNYLWGDGSDKILNNIIDVYNEYYNDNLKYPAYIFVSKYLEMFFYRTDGYLEKDENGNDDLILTLKSMGFNTKIKDIKLYTVNDFTKLKYILRAGKTPTYNPKDIIKESIEDNIFKIPPKTLTIEDQKKLFKVGDDVYIRPNAKEYFKDMDDYIMPNMLGEKGTIYKIDNFSNNYHSTDCYSYFPQNIIDDIKSGDLLIYVKVENIYESENYYWYYKCLATTKKLEPDYRPRSIIKESNDLNYPYRFKTKKEFIEEYGSDWINVALDNVGWNERMDCLFGQEFPFFKNQLNFNNKTYPISHRFLYKSNHWSIHWNMLTPNKKYKPEYNPRIIKK